jgi:raffinose/stachyose/melibiose transport system permease protein
MSSQSISVSDHARRSVSQVVKYVVAVTIAAIILVPIFTAVIGGFKTNAQLLLRPFSLPNPFVVTNYQSVLNNPSFWKQLLNSTLVMVATSIGVVILSAMPAFVFARVPFRGRELLFGFFSLGLLFPITVAILPLYITIRGLGLVNNLWGIVIPQLAFALSANILILKNFFVSVPKDLEEAASLDGVSTFGFFWRILLPLVRPSLAAVFVLTMVSSWNAFFLPLLVLNDEALFTLPLGIMQYQGQYGSDWTKILAFVSLALLPAVIFYLIAEKQIVEGLTAGAVKG